MLKITAGRTHTKLAKELAKELQIEYITAHIEKFADEELRIELEKELYQNDLIILQSTSRPVNDHLIELLLLIDAAKRAAARRIIAIVPYFGYSRQDNSSYHNGPISAKLIATLLEAAGVDHLITLDLHSAQSAGFFKIIIQNLSALDLFADKFVDYPDLILVSPDVGGIARVQKFSASFNLDFAIISKTRQKHNMCKANQLIGNVSGRKCLLIDDIIDTGNTLCAAAELLIKNGAESVEAFITHPVLSNFAVQNIMDSGIERIVISDSITHENLPAKFEIVTIKPLLRKIISSLLIKT